MIQLIRLTADQLPVFRERQFERLRRNLRVALLSGAVVALFFIPWNRWHDQTNELPVIELGTLLALGLVLSCLLTYWQPLQNHLGAVTLAASVFTLTIVSYLLVLLPSGFLYGVGALVSFTVLITVIAIDLSFLATIALGVAYLAIPNVALLLSNAPWLTFMNTNWILISGGLVGFGLAFLMDQSNRRAFVLEEALAAEKQRSDDLLRALLPSGVAEELKRSQTYIADIEPNSTVLFADLVGFTPLTQRLTPQNLISILTDVFTGLDELAAELGLEKIKTVGDAYMLAAGVADAAHSDASHVAEFAIRSLDLVTERTSAHGEALELRIGIATGPVVCGVIGRRKPHFDLWGATVNRASRLETSAPTGGIHVDAHTAGRLRHSYRLESRGRIELPGIGLVETCLLVGRKQDARVTAPRDGLLSDNGDHPVA
jgi:adenylate cyclase